LITDREVKPAMPAMTANAPSLWLNAEIAEDKFACAPRATPFPPSRGPAQGNPVAALLLAL
jgi:hypothetical protein